MKAEQKTRVEKLIIDHLRSEGALFQVSARFATEVGVAQSEVERVMLALFDRGEIAFDGEGSIRIVAGRELAATKSVRETSNGKPRRQAA